MKAKPTISKKGKRLESPKVEPSKQPVAQANKEDLDIDLEEFLRLSAVNNTLEKLYRTDPSATECEDEGNNAYKRACALLTYAEDADLGLMAEGSELGEPDSRAYHGFNPAPIGYRTTGWQTPVLYMPANITAARSA